jgi:hypothetical protein
VATTHYEGQTGHTYEVIERIGPGGFGSVDRVRRDDGEEFALKTLHGLEAEVLEAEAENLSSVEHENVVGYVDHGTDPEPFLVMELAKDGTLRDYLTPAQQRGEHFPLETIVDLARQLLSGLAAIHEVLVHRDMKPENVLFDGDVVKIADFGITRLVEASTRSETLKGAGTPLYMPPEGWEGLSGPSPTPTYDLYSLGVMLYELATLQPPFSGSRDELRQAHLYEEPRSPRELRDDLPPGLERLILQLLRKTPSERGASAEECLKLLEQVPIEEETEGADTSGVMTRLQEGASSLMRQAAAREAEQARIRDALASQRELVAQATTKLGEMMSEACEVVAGKVAPLEVTLAGGGGRWSLDLQHSTRQLTVELGTAQSQEVFSGANVPGKILGFGRIAIADAGQIIGGAQIVAFVKDDAPWVVHYQEIQLRNMPLMSTPMRNYEPFFLTDSELGQHGPWLWGGAMHIYTPQHRELTVEVIVEWAAELIPACPAKKRASGNRSARRRDLLRQLQRPVTD